MVFEYIEKLKRQYTDKYVIVDESRPELQRFKGLTGTVKTINMNGRALVEFVGHNNIGWYDIELDFLKVVDKPLPQPEEKPAKKAEKPAQAEAPAKAAKPAAAPAEKKPAPGGKMSVADMLAAARGTGGGASAPTKKEDKPKAAPAAAPAAKAEPAKMNVADVLAAARTKKGAAPAAPQADAGHAPAKAKPAPIAKAPAAAPAKLDPKKMSVTDMLAAARGEKLGAKPAAATAPPPAAEEEEVAEEPVSDAIAEPETAAPPKPTAAAGSGEPKKFAAGEKPTAIADIVAYCRTADTK